MELKSKWDNLTDEIQAKVLNSKVSCQGEQLTLRKWTTNHSHWMEELNLDAVLGNEIVEVGEPITTCHGYDERLFVHRTFFERDRRLKDPMKEVFSTENLDCERLSDYKEVVIADECATGKSAVLTNIALQYKHQNPGDLILMVDLNRCSKALLGLSFKHQDEATDFFIDKLVQSTHPKIFKELFASKRVVAFFDGSDELHPGPLNVFYELVALLIEKHVHQVWYTTTNTTLHTIGNKLVVCMKSFEQPHQVELMVKYWTVNGVNAENMRGTASEIIAKQEKDVEEKARGKIGALFMSRMLAEIFIPPNHNDLPAKFDVCWIYERFLDTDRVNRHKKVLQYLAMKIAFRHTMEALGYEDEFGYVAMPNDLDELPIVYPNGYGAMKFLHKTLVFYLVAEWFCNRYITEFPSAEFKKIYAYDDNDSDAFLMHDSFDIVEFINRIADRKALMMTDKDKLGGALLAKHRKEKKEKKINTLGVIFDHLCRRKFFGLFNVILKSWSHQKTANFINKYFDEVLYDENGKNLILRFEHRDSCRQTCRNGGLVLPMLEWASMHLTKENQRKLFSVKNDSDQCPLFWVVRGEDYMDYTGYIGYEAVKSVGRFYAEAFVDDKDAFFALLFCSKRKRKESSKVPEVGEALPSTSKNSGILRKREESSKVPEDGDTSNNSSDDSKRYDRRSIFFYMLWKAEIFRALVEVCEEAFGHAQLIHLLRFTRKGMVFTAGRTLLKISAANYQGIMRLLIDTLGHEEAFTQFVICKDERASFCALLAKANTDIFDKGCNMMEQKYEVDNLRSMLFVEAKIHASVFMAAIKNPNLEIFEKFLQLIIKLNNDDRELIDKTFQDFKKPLMTSAEVHFDMAELWTILKRYVMDIKNVTQNMRCKRGERTFLHIYIENHYRKEGFTDMFAKFWKMMRKDLDASIVDYLLESEFIEYFEYHTACSRHDIIENVDLERIMLLNGSSQSSYCNIC